LDISLGSFCPCFEKGVGKGEGAEGLECQASAADTSRRVLCKEATDASRCNRKGVNNRQPEIEENLTWSSALFAFSMAMSISLSPSPFDLYAPSISLRLGGGV
jgi:hypothetical protein